MTSASDRLDQSKHLYADTAWTMNADGQMRWGRIIVVSFLIVALPLALISACAAAIHDPYTYTGSATVIEKRHSPQSVMLHRTGSVTTSQVIPETHSLVVCHEEGECRSVRVSETIYETVDEGDSVDVHNGNVTGVREETA